MEESIKDCWEAIVLDFSEGCAFELGHTPWEVSGSESYTEITLGMSSKGHWFIKLK